MARTYIKDLKVGEKVTVKGWLHEIRGLAKVKFLILRDYTGIIQCVATSDNEELFKKVKTLNPETVVEITGSVVANKIAKQGYEVAVEDLNILGEVSQVLPIQVVEKGDINTDLSTRMDNRFLDLRKPEINKIFQFRNTIYKTTVDFFMKNDFMNIATPKMTSAGVESGAEMFSIKYFNTKAYLSQSPQIYKQMMVCSGFEKVFEIGSIFRAENSNTTRHVTEFIGIDFEMAFVTDENELMDFTEEYIKELVKATKAEVKVPSKIPRVPFEEVRDMLNKKGKKITDDIDPESEKLLGELVLKKYKSDLIFVTNYPWSKRPFYHVKNGDGTKGFDLLLRGVEIATGSLREHNYDILKKQAEEKDVKLDDMKDYAVMFKCGAPPHGGCGLGMERITQNLLGLDNIREACFVPRDPDRLTP
ncbi:aspartate--tRNA(Asn) ligase [archaeon]|jgi:nondiscriminating aspartyl-tRNA synthetase|nr:aspartate--tRNA(Asn) ligase [archaeon]MBT4416818.1 aspartate--tRNA(Asn) ligase [archaeon]